MIRDCTQLIQQVNLYYFITSMKNKADLITKNKTFASIPAVRDKPVDHTPNQFRQLAKSKDSRGLRQDQSNPKQGSFSDSQSSDSSCYQKKFYRCGCLNHRQGCGVQKYQDYLGIMREQRQRKRLQKSFSELISANIQKGMPFLNSEKDEQKDSTFEAIRTPEKSVSELHKIVQINESAQFSIKKVHQSICITLNGRRYSKIFQNRDEAIRCLQLIKQLICQNLIQQIKQRQSQSY